MIQTQDNLAERFVKALEEAERKIAQHPTAELKQLQAEIDYLQSIDEIFTAKAISPAKQDNR